MYPAICGICDTYLGDYDTAEAASAAVAKHMFIHR